GHRPTAWISVKTAANVVGKGRGRVRGYRNEIGISAAGKLRRDTETAIVFVEVKIHPQSASQVPEIIVVFDVAPQRVASADSGAIFAHRESRGAVVSAPGPGRKRAPSARGEIGRAILAITNDVTG